MNYVQEQLIRYFIKKTVSKSYEPLTAKKSGELNNKSCIIRTHVWFLKSFNKSGEKVNLPGKKGFRKPKVFKNQFLAPP